MSIRQRVVVGTVACLGVVGGSVGLYAVQGPDHAATEVQLEDTAGVIYEPDLREAIDDIRFYEPTTVAVFTHRGGPEARYDDYALNDAVLAYARETRNDWLSEDEQKFAPDLFIFAVDPEGRLVGTYFGENRKVGEGTQLDIQDAAKDEYRRGQWTEGTILGVQAGADRMNAPGIRTTGGTIAAAIASLLTLGGAGAYYGVGKRRQGKSRSARETGDRSMANVVRDYEATEIHAKLLPEESRYGGAMLERYDTYTHGFRELTEVGNQARSVPERDYDTPAALETLTTYRDKATSLDELDDVIADTAALLNKDQAWPEAWERQVAPLREDLAKVDSLISSTLNSSARGVTEAQSLREFSSQATADLEQLRGDLENGAVTPDDALDRLRNTRDDLSGHLDRLATAVANVSDYSASERRTMERQMGETRRERVGRPTILTTSYPTWTWYPVDSFRDGYNSGTRKVEQSRSSSSSSGGSTSGFSSSGGSFSGAGSSSRF